MRGALRRVAWSGLARIAARSAVRRRQRLRPPRPGDATWRPTAPSARRATRQPTDARHAAVSWARALATVAVAMFPRLALVPTSRETLIRSADTTVPFATTAWTAAISG